MTTLFSHSSSSSLESLGVPWFPWWKSWCVNFVGRLIKMIGSSYPVAFGEDQYDCQCERVTCQKYILSSWRALQYPQYPNFWRWHQCANKSFSNSIAMLWSSTPQSYGYGFRCSASTGCNRDIADSNLRYIIPCTLCLEVRDYPHHNFKRSAIGETLVIWLALTCPYIS